MTRTLDAADRVIAIDYPGTALDITYTYHDQAVPFSKGRLTRIARAGQGIDYRQRRVRFRCQGLDPIDRLEREV